MGGFDYENDECVCACVCVCLCVVQFGNIFLSLFESSHLKRCHHLINNNKIQDIKDIKIETNEHVK